MGDAERKNVIVVGAGASAEFGLPVGAALKREIADLCSYVEKGGGSWGYKNERFYDLIEALVHSNSKPDVGASELRNQYRQAAVAISENMNLAPSIDNFMDTHSEHEALISVGKLAIAELIFAAEGRSFLGTPKNRRALSNDQYWLNTSQTWMGKLFGILVAQRDFDSFLRALENITFVCFNYDRCIEQFFLRASASYFRSPNTSMDASILKRIEEALQVIHPYGAVGDLNFQSLDRTGFGRNYISNELLELVKVSNGIQTFTEGEVSENVSPWIRYALDDCEVLIFLGFAFHPLNMKLLTRFDNPFAVDRVMATGMGLSSESQEYVKREIATNYVGGNLDAVSMVDGKCSDLFDFHYRYLSGQVHQQEVTLEYL